MIRIDIRGVDAVQRKLAGIQRDMRAKVIQPALNKLAEKARAEINRAIPQEYNVKASEVRNAVTLRRASSGNLQAVIEVFGSARKRGRSMNMIHFLQTVVRAGQQIKLRGAKGKKAEVAAMQKQLGFLIKKGGGLKKVEGAFVGNKGRTIFRRTGNARLPIEPLQVIGFSQMFKSRKIEQRVIGRISSELPVEIDRSLARLLA